MGSNKNVLAKKSNKRIIQMWVCFFLGLLLLPLVIMVMLFFKDDSDKTEFYKWALLLAFLIVLLILILYEIRKLAVRPQIVIEYDENGIYLNYSINKIIYIAYGDIEDVRAHRRWGRHFVRYSFGSITIITKNSEYSIGVIEEVENVKSFILGKVNNESN